MGFALLYLVFYCLCLFFFFFLSFDLRLLITALVSSNFYWELRHLSVNDGFLVVETRIFCRYFICSRKVEWTRAEQSACHANLIFRTINSPDNPWHEPWVHKETRLFEHTILEILILSDTDQHNFKYSSFWCNVVGRDNNWWTFFLSSWLLQNNQIRHYPIQKRTHEHVFVAKIEDVNHLSIFLVWK